MKLGVSIIIYICIFTLTGLFGQWSDPIFVSEGANPDLDVDWQTGDVYILTMLQGVTVTKLNKDGVKISQEVVTPALSDKGGDYWGASIAVGPNGEPHVVYRNIERNYAISGFYTVKSNVWSSPVQIYKKLTRAWTPRIDVDEMGRAHIIYGVAEEEIEGDIYYRRIENGIITAKKDGMSRFRADVNHELCVTPDGEIHMITGKASYPIGPIYYYNSLNGGDTWEGYGDIHDADARNANGFVDISQDAQKNFHVCYGNERDYTFKQPAIRYVRIKNNVKEYDVLVTEKGEIEQIHLKLGLSSVAASEDGKFVMITYITSQNGGKLYSRLSEDGGRTWGERELLAQDINSLGGRSRQYIRSYKHRFYLIYPHQGIKFRYYQIPGYEESTPEANGPYSGDEGSPIQFSATGTVAPAGVVSYAWDWNNDGVFDDSTETENISHTFEDDYNGQIALRIRTPTGSTATDFAALTVANVTPTVSFGGSITINEGESVPFNANSNDPGANDKLSYQWNFGDGTSSSEINPDHAYADNDSYTVTLTVADDDGAQVSAQKQITVNNVAPKANAGGPYRGKQGESIAVQGEATDPGSADILTYKWDLDGDGQFETNGKSTTVQYAADGSYTITLKVTDDDGGQSVDQAIIVVGSGAPQIAVIPAQTINEGGQFAPIRLDDFVIDPDDPIDAITWNSDGNFRLEVSIKNRIVSIATPNENWYGQEMLTFIATDPGGNTDSVQVSFKVISVNDPPEILKISNQIVSENELFKSIKLDEYVKDIDHTAMQMNWTYSGNQSINIKIDNRVAKIAVPDSEWAGSENVTFSVADPDSDQAQTTVTFTVIAVNDPPQILNLSDQEFFQYGDFKPIYLDTCVFDPDNSVGQLNWSHNASNHFNVSLINHILDVEPKDVNWFGSERITIKVTDPASQLTTKNLKFTVLKVSARPTIKTIPDQTIDEGNQFRTINLDNYVTDLNNSPNEIKWECTGEKQLKIEWNQHIVSLQPPDTEWAGQEAVSFVATDPDLLKDTTSVTFTVNEVPDPPSISNIPDIFFNEDAFYDIPLALLRENATDLDHPVDSLTFGLKDQVNIQWELQPSTNKLHIYATFDFCGIEDVKLFVQDPTGEIGTQPLRINVISTPDPLRSFDIIRPKIQSMFIWTPTKEFVWEAAVDPDPEDIVTYQWLLSRTAVFTDTFNTDFIVSDTVYVHHATKTMWKGAYFWKVIARSTDGTSQETSTGQITTQVDDVESSGTRDLPKEFALFPNHPNPFNPETQITYQLPRATTVKLSIFNSLGQRVRQLVQEQKSAGTYQVTWNANDDFGNRVSSGIYICKLETNETSYYIKMLLAQ